MRHKGCKGGEEMQVAERVREQKGDRDNKDWGRWKGRMTSVRETVYEWIYR